MIHVESIPTLCGSKKQCPYLQETQYVRGLCVVVADDGSLTNSRSEGRTFPEGAVLDSSGKEGRRVNFFPEIETKFRC